MITLSIMLATIMQTLDSTIANVALPHMQGTLSASQNQIAWVLTAYIVASAIATPLTGWLCDRFGQKHIFMASISGFTVASALCGMSNSLAEIVAARLLQGGVRRGAGPVGAGCSHGDQPARESRAPPWRCGEWASWSGPSSDLRWAGG